MLLLVIKQKYKFIYLLPFNWSFWLLLYLPITRVIKLFFFFIANYHKNTSKLFLKSNRFFGHSLKGIIYLFRHVPIKSVLHSYQRTMWGLRNCRRCGRQWRESDLHWGNQKTDQDGTISPKTCGSTASYWRWRVLILVVQWHSLNN